MPCRTSFERILPNPGPNRNAPISAPSRSRSSAFNSFNDVIDCA